MALTQASEGGLKISNAGTNGQYLQKQSGNTGGLTWADVPAGVGGSTGVDFNDDVKARFGTDNDVEIYHKNSTSENWIDATVNNLKLKGKTLVGLYADSDPVLLGWPNGKTKLYYDGSDKCETHADGLLFEDDKKVLIGTGSDLQLYHDASNSYILNTTGNLIIKDTTDAVYVQAPSILFQDDTTNENIAKFISDGACELYYDNVKKFETTADGITMSGWIYIPDGAGDGSTNSLRIGNGADLKLYHDGSNTVINNSTGDLYQKCANDQFFRVSGDESGIDIHGDGAVELFYDNSKKFETTATGTKVTGTLEQTGYCLDEWRLHTSLRGDVSPITNWERCDSTGMANKLIDDSSGIAESSGIFTFPSNGKWKITTFMQYQTPSGQTEAWCGMHAAFSQDGTNYVSQDWQYSSMAAASSYQRGVSGFTLDVTNKDNAKLKFSSVMDQDNNSTGTYLLGQTAYNATWIRFERIGDT